VSDPSSLQYQVTYVPDLSLATYRELAAHLEQVDGMTTELIWRDHPEFDYHASQISSMWLRCSATFPQVQRSRVTEILNHYGNWQSVPKLFGT
jgi:hypothetical protein